MPAARAATRECICILVRFNEWDLSEVGMGITSGASIAR